MSVSIWKLFYFHNIYFINILNDIYIIKKKG